MKKIQIPILVRVFNRKESKGLRKEREFFCSQRREVAKFSATNCTNLHEFLFRKIHSLSFR